MRASSPITAGKARRSARVEGESGKHADFAAKSVHAASNAFHVESRSASITQSLRRYAPGMEFSPAQLGMAERSKLMTGAIVPRPIAFVSTVSPDGRPNIAPYSFFCGVGSNPMTLLFCPANNTDGSDKDSLRNALPPDQGGTGEFVVNVVQFAYARQMSMAADALPYGESEFDYAGLHTAPSHVVRAPRLRESPVAFECRTLQVIRTNPGAIAGGNIVLGEIVHVFVRDDLLNDRLHVDPATLDAVGRLGGLSYCRIHDRFDMPRGK